MLSYGRIWNSRTETEYGYVSGHRLLSEPAGRGGPHVSYLSSCFSNFLVHTVYLADYSHWKYLFSILIVLWAAFSILVVKKVLNLVLQLVAVF